MGHDSTSVASSSTIEDERCIPKFISEVKSVVQIHLGVYLNYYFHFQSYLSGYLAFSMEDASKGCNR